MLNGAVFNKTIYLVVFESVKKNFKMTEGKWKILGKGAIFVKNLNNIVLNSKDLALLRSGKPSNWSRIVFKNFISKNDFNIVIFNRLFCTNSEQK